MTAYSVYTPGSGALAKSENFRIISEGRSTFALIAPPVWLVWNRLWLELVAYLVIMAGLFTIYEMNPHILLLYASALPGFYLFLEGNQLVASGLLRQGWRYAATFDAENMEEAELRYLATLNDEPGVRIQGQDAAPATPKAGYTGAAGLFPE